MTAVIPAKGTSERCKCKNIRPFANTTLLEIKIRQCLELTDKIDNIIVNSESDIVKNIVEKYDNVTFVKRDPVLSLSTTTARQFYVGILSDIKDDIICLNCTNPLLKTETIRNFIDIYLNMDRNLYGSLNSTTKVKDFIWFNNKPITYDYDNKPRSQDIKGFQKLNYAISILDNYSFEKNLEVTASNPLLIDIPEEEGFDIDTEFEFMIAEQMYMKQSSGNNNITNIYSLKQV